MRYRTEIWSEAAPKVELVSTSWKSMVEQERLDRAYRAFVCELHRQLSQVNEKASFEKGVDVLPYWCGVAVCAATLFAVAALVVRAMQTGAWQGAVIIAAFAALFLWQAGRYFRRNRPGRYRPDALPADLIPPP
ncbi:MAG TPA: hypothetical protein VFL51_01310 [Pseudolabrys sp.]|nr:hypothetical protein [Pseudolabrys sp.]